MFDRTREDTGVALIVAILVVALVFALGTIVVATSVHNSQQSANDRERVQAVAAAEAGIHAYMAELATATVATVSCTFSDQMNITPGAQYALTPTFYDAAGNEIPCDPSTGLATVPVSVALRSVGTAVGQNPKRTMVSQIGLEPNEGNPFGPGAIFSDQTPEFSQKLNLDPYLGTDADLYTNGDLVLDQGGSASAVDGSIYAQGSITITNGSVSNVRGDVHAVDDVTLGSGTVWGNILSSTGSVHMSGGNVKGDAYAKVAINDPGADDIDGSEIIKDDLAPPPSRSFPTFAYEPSDWTNEGYQIQTFSGADACTDARDYINGSITSGQKRVVRIDSTCELTGDFTARGDLAVISNGTFKQQGVSQKVSSNGSPHNLFLIFSLDQPTPCSTVSVEFRGGVDTQLNTFVHTPCVVEFKTSSFAGQIFAGQFKTLGGNNTKMIYRPVIVPGTAGGGFQQSIHYIREVPST